MISDILHKWGEILVILFLHENGEAIAIAIAEFLLPEQCMQMYACTLITLCLGQ